MAERERAWTGGKRALTVGLIHVMDVEPAKYFAKEDGKENDPALKEDGGHEGREEQHEGKILDMQRGHGLTLS